MDILNETLGKNKKMSDTVGMIFSVAEGCLVSGIQDFMFHTETGEIQGWVVKSQHFFSQKEVSGNVGYKL